MIQKPNTNVVTAINPQLTELIMYLFIVMIIKWIMSKIWLNIHARIVNCLIYLTRMDFVKYVILKQLKQVECTSKIRL